MVLSLWWVQDDQACKQFDTENWNETQHFFSLPRFHGVSLALKWFSTGQDQSVPKAILRVLVHSGFFRGISPIYCFTVICFLQIVTNCTKQADMTKYYTSNSKTNKIGSFFCFKASSVMCGSNNKRLCFTSRLSHYREGELQWKICPVSITNSSTVPCDVHPSLTKYHCRLRKTGMGKTGEVFCSLLIV